jgi:hypothetical protein
MPTATLYPVHLQYCLRRMHAGDSATEEELLRAAGNRLERLARRTLCTLPNVRLCADTSDVFQEAVLRLLGSLPQHKQHRNPCVTFEAWRSLSDATCLIWPAAAAPLSVAKMWSKHNTVRWRTQPDGIGG